MGVCPNVIEFYTFRGLGVFPEAFCNDLFRYILKRAGKALFGPFWVTFPTTLNEVMIDHFSISHGFAMRSHCKLVDGREKNKIK